MSPVRYYRNAPMLDDGGRPVSQGWPPLPIVAFTGWRCDECKGIKWDTPIADPFLPLHKLGCKSRDPII